jgi:hypothetical protein
VGLRRVPNEIWWLALRIEESGEELDDLSCFGYVDRELDVESYVVRVSACCRYTLFKGEVTRKLGLTPTIMLTRCLSELTLGIIESSDDLVLYIRKQHAQVPGEWCPNDCDVVWIVFVDFQRAECLKILDSVLGNK